jgi:hypothetical protein
MLDAMSGKHGFLGSGFFSLNTSANRDPSLNEQYFYDHWADFLTVTARLTLAG